MTKWKNIFYDIWNIFTLQGLQSKWKKILNKKTYLLVQNFGSDEEFCLNIEACKVRASVLRCPLKNKMFVSNGRWGLFFLVFFRTFTLGPTKILPQGSSNHLNDNGSLAITEFTFFLWNVSNLWDKSRKIQIEQLTIEMFSWKLVKIATKTQRYLWRNSQNSSPLS